MSTVTIDRDTVALWELQGEGKVGYWDRALIEDVVERVNRGATKLDEVKPKWNYEVVPEKLQMDSGTMCIVGQTYGEYDEYVGPVFGREPFEEDLQDSIAHAFFAETEEWPLLDRVWVYLLTTRAETGRPVTLEMPEPEPRNTAYQRIQDAGLLDQ